MQWSTESYQPGNEVKLLHSGRPYFDALEKLIDGARQSIHLQVYIFEQDATGKHIVDALIRAAKRGVTVYLLVDDFGSHALSEHWRNALVEAGIHFRTFSPIFTSKRKWLQFGRRLHVKVIVADKKMALIGGVNIADKYRGSKDERPWLDFAVQVEGSICEEIDTICEDIWSKIKLQKKDAVTGHHVENDTGTLIKVNLNDWVRRKDGIARDYNTAFEAAEESIVIIGSYFIPGRKTRKALNKASEKGVEISIIMSGISDVPIVKHASNWLYDWFFRKKIKIYEYQPSVLHGKAAVVDKIWSSVGSYNFNYLSEYISVELNVSVFDKKFSENLYKDLHEIMSATCKQIMLEDYVKRTGIFQQFGNWLAYHVVKFLMHLYFTLTKNELDDGGI